MKQRKRPVFSKRTLISLLRLCVAAWFIHSLSHIDFTYIFNGAAFSGGQLTGATIEYLYQLMALPTSLFALWRLEQK